MKVQEETYYIIKLAQGGDWGRISSLVRSLKGKPGLSLSYNEYSKVYTVVIWDESTKEVVRLLKDQVEEAGGVWKVAV